MRGEGWAHDRLRLGAREDEGGRANRLTFVFFVTPHIVFMFVDCVYTLHMHCGLLLRLDRLSEAATTWLPRRGVNPRELDGFQISNLIAAKKSAFATG